MRKSADCHFAGLATARGRICTWGGDLRVKSAPRLALALVATALSEASECHRMDDGQGPGATRSPLFGGRTDMAKNGSMFG